MWQPTSRYIAVLGISAMTWIALPSAKAEETKAEAQPATQPTAVELCPVSGEPIGSMGDGYVVDYKGRSVTLCCEGCESAFNKDPEGYLKKLDEKKAADKKSAAKKDSEEKPAAADSDSKGDAHDHAH